jgi:hypothetical protein
MLGLGGVHKRVEAAVTTYPCAQTPILEEFGYQAKLCREARSANGCVIEGERWRGGRGDRRRLPYYRGDLW